MLRRAMWVLLFLSAAAAALLAIGGGGGRGVPLSWSDEELAMRADSDAGRLVRSITAIDRLHAELERAQSLFDRPPNQTLLAEERQQATALFAAVLEQVRSLDTLVGFHFGIWRSRWREAVVGEPAVAAHFAIGFAAYVEKLSLGIRFVELTLNRPQFEKLLDEGDPALGVAAGTFARLKINVVNVRDVVQTLAAHQYVKVFRNALLQLSSRNLAYAAVRERLDDRYAVVKDTLITKATTLFGGQTLDIAADVGHAAWFPVQSGSAEWLGDTKVRRHHRMLISMAQVEAMSALSKPGDVIVERRNWYLSNIGLPGFWPHAAMWVGTPQELSTAFDNDNTVTAHFGKPLSELLAERYPAAWRSYNSPDHEGHARRIIEAVSEGVVFAAPEESIFADYVAAMRPRLSAVEVALAIERAFSYAGRPYDFDFDFYTDQSLVCSELVYKAYEPRKATRGLRFTLEKMVGRMTLGPNAMVRAFDEQYDDASNRQLDFVWFLDGREGSNSAVESDVLAFRNSWKRPKWDIVQQ